MFSPLIPPPPSPQFPSAIKLLKGILTLDTPSFDSVPTGFLASVSGAFAGLPVAASIAFQNAESAAKDGRRLLVKLSASNANLKSVILNLWASAPASVTDALGGITFASLTSDMLPNGAPRRLSRAAGSGCQL